MFNQNHIEIWIWYTLVNPSCIVELLQLRWGFPLILWIYYFSQWWSMRINYKIDRKLCSLFFWLTSGWMIQFINRFEEIFFKLYWVLNGLDWYDKTCFSEIFVVFNRFSNCYLTVQGISSAFCGPIFLLTKSWIYRKVSCWN